MNNNASFSRFVGVEKAELALRLTLINPSIGGLLISGEKGTAKSSIVHSLPAITDRRIIKVPLSISEERLLGAIDLERVISQGEQHYSRGLLAEADGQLLFIDNFNLLSPSLQQLLLEAHANGSYTLQMGRDSKRFPCRFILIATMNPEEGSLRSTVLDRFGLFVELRTNTKQLERIRMIENHYKQERPETIALYQAEDLRIREELLLAQQLLPHVALKAIDYEAIAQMAHEAFMAGHRGEIMLAHAVTAYAALKQRRHITQQDLLEVQSLALDHRLRTAHSAPETPNHENQSPPEQPSSEQPHDDGTSSETSPKEHENTPSDEQTGASDETNRPSAPPTSSDREAEERAFEIADTPMRTDLLTWPDRRKKDCGFGKRLRTKSDMRKGRAIRAQKPRKACRDLSIEATLRVAVMHQRGRTKRKGLAITVETSDLREKVREHRTGHTILFLVDSSGSMGARQAMSEAKASVYSLLQNAYVKRDRVGMMVFRQEEATLLLAPTRSVERAYALLKEIKTGGRTPLLMALQKAHTLFTSLQKKEQALSPLLVIFTDGKSNSRYPAENSLQELAKIAQKICLAKIKTIVVDTELGFIRLGRARRLATMLEATYHHLDQLKKDNLQEIILNNHFY